MVTDDPIGSGLGRQSAAAGRQRDRAFPDAGGDRCKVAADAEGSRAPGRVNVGVLLQRSEAPFRAKLMKELEPAPASLGVSLLPVDVGRPRTCKAVSR